jgi:hypothetical protein
MPIVGITLYLTVPTFFVVCGLIAGYLVIYIVARLSGFSAKTRMQYSLDFLHGERGLTYDEKGYRRVSWTKSFLSFFLLIVLPWLAYSIADQEGYTTLSSLIVLTLITTWILVEIFSRRKRGSDKKGINVLDRKVEDWAGDHWQPHHRPSRQRFRSSCLDLGTRLSHLPSLGNKIPLRRSKGARAGCLLNRKKLLEIQKKRRILFPSIRSHSGRSRSLFG